MRILGAAFRAMVGLVVLVAGGATTAMAQSETFGVTGTIETWTVPADGRYRVTLVGAQGGANGYSASYGTETGGLGARVSAEFDFVAGDVYQYAVGQEGGARGFNYYAAGGGGGTFFVGSDDQPILIAGGGGGVRSEGFQPGTDANTGEAGMNATTNYLGPVGRPWVASPKLTGIGFGGNENSVYGSGGAGFGGDGVSSSWACSGDGGGKSWANGLAGGGIHAEGGGGFGGGGGGEWCNSNAGGGGGGGGGYSGGDGGMIAGGGGSFLSGANQQAAAGVGYGDGSITFELVVDEEESADKAAAIGAFMAERQQLILANGPDLSRRISRFNGGFSAGSVGVEGFGYMSTDLPLNLQVGPNRMRFTYDSSAAAAAAGVGAATRSSDDLSGGQLLGYAPALTPDGGAGNVVESSSISDLAFWAEGTFARTSEGTLFGIVHTGGDILLNDRMLVGIGLSVDSTRQESAVADIEGLGYMVGPYATFRVSDELYLDVRVAVGQSSNKITMLGETDEFATTRWLGTAALVGDYQFGIVNVAPEARLSFMDETSDAYTDADDNEVPSVQVSTGTLELGPRISVDLEGDGVTWSPYVEGSAIWTFQQQNSGGDPLADQFARLRARIGAGTSVTTDGTISGSAGVFYDGIGSDLSAWGARLGISGAL